MLFQRTNISMPRVHKQKNAKEKRNLAQRYANAKLCNLFIKTIILPESVNVYIIF